MNKTIFSSFLGFVILIIISCARQSAPTGGPKDETPPKFIKSNPDTLATNVNVNLKEVIINFDEYLLLKDYSKNVVFSPAFKTSPVVTPQGMAKKYISIKFQEPLLANTTYSFNFGDAIQDFNENNILSNFQYVFSTGPYIDSLKVSGRVNSSYNYNVPEKILVGLYKVDKDYKDSIVFQKKPNYITRADKEGNYKLNYLASGKYKLISFEDKVENIIYDYGKELFAFHSGFLELNSNENINLVLFDQKGSYRKPDTKYIQDGLLSFKLSGADVSEVKIEPINKTFKTAHTQRFPKKDSINFWFNPKIDSIPKKEAKTGFKVLYKNKIDTVYVLLNNKHNQENKLDLKAINGEKLAPNKTFNIKSSTPVKSFDVSKMKVFKDTVAVPYKVEIDSLNSQSIKFAFDKEPGQKFQINLYPDAFEGVSGDKNDTITLVANVGEKNDFGNLKLKLNNPPKKPFILQLLTNDNDFKILDTSYNKPETNVFQYLFLEPGEYLFRLLVDENENGKWDTGDYLANKQPEPIYLYPEPIKIRAVWDADETWVLGEPNQPVFINKDDEKDKTKKGSKKGESKEAENKGGISSLFGGN